MRQARKLPGRRFARLALTGLLIAIGSTALPAPLTAAPLAADPPAFDLQGHRGARGLYPENSLPGFEAALALGVTTLEMDLAVTRDGVVVVHHDRRIDPARTRGPNGAWLDPPVPAIIELSRAELATYDIGRARPGGKVAKRFPAQQGLDGVAIPTLADVLALGEARSGGTMRYNLEIKTSPHAPQEALAPAAFAAALARDLDRAGVGSRAMVQSFDWRGLQALQALAPGIPTVYLSAEARWLDNLERGQPGVSPWTAGLDLDDFGGFGAGGGPGRGRGRMVALFSRPWRGRAACGPGSRPQSRGLDRQRPRQYGRPDRARRRRHHHRLSGPLAPGHGRTGSDAAAGLSR